MNLREFSEKVETITGKYGDVRGYVYDDDKIRIVGCEETEAHRWQVNLVDKETKKVRCVATRVNRSNVIRFMLKYYNIAIGD